MYFHSLSPYLVQFSDGFGIQWNGLSLMLSLVTAFIFMGWMSSRQRSELVPKMLGDFVMTCTVGALIGGRLGYCLFYSPDLFVKFRSEFPFWGLLAVDEGGMSAYGAILGLVAAATIFAVRTGVSRLYLYDLLAVTGPIGIFFGRLANFMTGELIGRPVKGEVPYTVKFPTEIYFWPQSADSRLADLAPIVEKFGVEKEKWDQLLLQKADDPQALTAVNELMVQIVRAIQSGNQEIQSLLSPLLADRHPSQLYGAAGEGVLIFLFLFLLWRKPRRPGVVASVFLILYGLMRYVHEMFRLPNPAHEMGALDLTRGQLLSVVCFLIGLTLLFVWGRRETLASPGWSRGHSVKLHRR
jgi:phosphatidylglycerol:prolipoprotein diacylglycerol transferase